MKNLFEEKKNAYYALLLFKIHFLVFTSMGVHIIFFIINVICLQRHPQIFQR